MPVVRTLSARLGRGSTSRNVLGWLTAMPLVFGVGCRLREGEHCVCANDCRGGLACITDQGALQPDTCTEDPSGICTEHGAQMGGMMPDVRPAVPNDETKRDLPTWDDTLDPSTSSPSTEDPSSSTGDSATASGSTLPASGSTDGSDGTSASTDDTSTGTASASETNNTATDVSGSSEATAAGSGTSTDATAADGTTDGTSAADGTSDGSTSADGNLD